MNSPLPPSLREDRTCRLRMVDSGDGGTGDLGTVGPGPGRSATSTLSTVSDSPTPPTSPTMTTTPEVGGRVVGGVVALPARSRARVRRAAGRVLRRTFEIAGGRPLVERLSAVHAEVAQQREQIEAMRAGWVDAELSRAVQDRGLRDAESNRVNLELLKGEVRELQHTLEELGMAFAPATGLAGAAARFAELREAVNGLERRLRNLTLTGPAHDGGGPNTVATAGPAQPTERAGHTEPTQPTEPAQASTLFNYVGFERRFRGDPEAINATLLDRYGDLLAGHQPVVDIGCGRAELLESLAARGVEVVGVEPDPGMVAEGRDRGVTVHQALAGEYLRSVPDASLGSIITTHVVEHLPLDALIEMLELSVRKLRPGGVFVGETPNPASLIVLGNSYILDPTHVMPLHPSLLAFLCESAGFRDVRLRFYSPASGYQLPAVRPPGRSPRWAVAMAGQVNTAFDQLNTVLFGPQEYAVVALTPPRPDN